MPKKRLPDPPKPKVKPRVTGPNVKLINTRAGDPTVMDKFPEHARLIGCIVAEWTQVEHKMVVLLCSMMQGDDSKAARAMLYALSTSLGRVQLIQAALAELSGDSEAARATIKEISDEATYQLGKRNDLAHALFGVTDDGKLGTFSYRRRKATEVKLDELEALYARMQTFSHKLGTALTNAMIYRQARRAGFAASDLERIAQLDSKLAQNDQPQPTPPPPSPE